MNRNQDGQGVSKVPASPEEQNAVRRAHKARQKADRKARKGAFGSDTVQVGLSLVQRKEIAAENVRLKEILKVCAEDRKAAIEGQIAKNTRKLTRS